MRPGRAYNGTVIVIRCTPTLLAVLSALALFVLPAACSSSPSSGSGGSRGSGKTGGAAKPEAPKPLPEVSFRLLDGGEWRSEAMRGRVVVLDVWASYCEPCIKAFPKLNELTQTYANVQVIGVSVDEEDSAVRAFLAKVPALFPIARDPELTVRDGPLGITKLPTVLVVDERGMVRYRKDEMTEADYNTLRAMVAELAAGSQPR